MKVQFIAVVVPEPKLLILDEPTAGLDPVSADSIRKGISEMRARGCTVILSTHDVALAETLCDSIVMIYRGKKVLDGSVKSVKSGYGQEALRVQTEGDLAVLKDLPGVIAVRNLGTVQQLELADMSYSQRVIRELATRTTILSLSVVKPTLHDIFVAIARPNGSGEPA